MKSISKFSWIGIIAGFIYAVGSFVRYYIIYQDLSEVVIGISIGCLIMIVSWLYSEKLKLQHTIDYLEEYLAEKLKSEQEDKNVES